MLEIYKFTDEVKKDNDMLLKYTAILESNGLSTTEKIQAIELLETYLINNLK